MSYFGSSAAVQLNLATNANHGGLAEGDVFQDHIEIVHGSQFADTILGSAGAETLRGFGGNDVLRGQSGNDMLEGGDGNDQLDGGAGADRFLGDAGIDLVTYFSSSAAVQLNLMTNVNHGGLAEGDTFQDVIETVHGSQFGDTIIGAAGTETLRGFGGNDVLRGQAGASLEGGNGDDLLYASAGADRFLGGDGFDTLSYADSSAGVTVNLLLGTGSGGAAAGDRYLDGFDAVIGSGFNDTLIGGAAAESFTGGAGIDTVSYSGSAAAVTVDMVTRLGTGGTAEGDRYLDVFESITGTGFNDTLIGGDGAGVISGNNGDDLLMGGAGADRFRGGDGFDTISYADSTVGVSINLTTNVNTGGTAEGDLFLDTVEKVIGSAFNDTLIGKFGPDNLFGGDGDDLLVGNSRNNTLDGGNGADILRGGDWADVLIGGAGDDRLEGHSRENTLDGGLGADTLVGGVTYDYDDFEGVEFVNRGNTLTGGAGADRFVSEGVSTRYDYGADRITDFSHVEGDKIDLSEIASSISFIGTADFTGMAGQLRYEYVASGNYTALSLDRDGDGVGDFVGFTLAGNVTLTADDFIL
ncbi:calcium-binding protein [Inquilinus limosus]|uniref:Uncharacterized protein n=1 Tax=Inquilinus limosus MP06 TaxID=1398085 RepID=A0A0A0CY38_9PROT|nr:calcium-binding protein [Inquilinus limosus]KGM30720.1 hypothetical protein P409_31380 [Inquilinus limosus MP06]